MADRPSSGSQRRAAAWKRWTTSLAVAVAVQLAVILALRGKLPDQYVRATAIGAFAGVMMTGGGGWRGGRMLLVRAVWVAVFVAGMLLVQWLWPDT